MRWIAALVLVACAHPAPRASDSRAPDKPCDPGYRARPRGVAGAVGWVMVGTGRCTATAIAPRRVLTAAHCIATDQISLYFSPSNDVRLVRSWYIPVAGRDLAIGLLDDAVPPPFARVARAPVAGGEARLLSRGACDSEQWLQLYARRFSWLGASRVPWAELCVCRGASGSPVIVGGSVVGVAVGWEGDETVLTLVGR